MSFLRRSMLSCFPSMPCLGGPVRRSETRAGWTSVQMLRGLRDVEANTSRLHRPRFSGTW